MKPALARALPLGLALALGLARGAAGQGPDPALGQLYQQLAQPPVAQSAPIHNLGFSWEGMRFLLQDGEMALAAPVAGRVTAAVFTGHGILQVLPPNAMERQQMLRFTGRGDIAQGFTQAVFRFADSALFLRVLGHAAFTPDANPHDAEHILADRAQALAKRGSPLVARLMQALDAAPPSALFLAELKLSGNQWLSAQFDPGQPAPVRVYAWTEIPGADGPAYPNVWTQYTPAGRAPPPPAPRLDHYSLELSLSGRLELDAEARCDLVAPAGSGRGLLLALDHNLRLERVATAGGAALAWWQPSGGDWFYVQLPQPLAAGQALPLRLRYRGKAPLLRGDSGDDATSLPGWYPSLGLDLPWALPLPSASYDLQFAVDKKFALLATGAPVPAPAVAADKDTVPSAWHSPRPLPAAGFALGESQDDIRSVGLADGRALPLRLAVPKHGDPDALLPLAGAKLVDILNFMERYFGPYPYPALSATVTDAEPAMPLPMLATMDPESFLDEPPTLSDVAPAVNVAGQWWGAWTTPATPQDEWLVAGLRAASGLLYLQAHRGPDASLPTLQAWRRALLERAPISRHIPILLGPLALGSARLGSNLDDGGELVALKGAYAIYMLRQMMWNPRRPDPDAGFIAMMRDFTSRYGGRAVTSAQFQRVVEAHMLPVMNLDGSHSMDWFFRPLLEGIGAPHLTFKAETAPAQKGVSRVTITVDNPQHWRGLLPVYFFQNQTTWLRGLMPVTQPQQTLTLPLPFAPQFVEANHLLDMLVEVAQ